VCDDEEASSAFTHPTIPSRPEGLVGLPVGPSLGPLYKFYNTLSHLHAYLASSIGLKVSENPPQAPLGAPGGRGRGCGAGNGMPTLVPQLTQAPPPLCSEVHSSGNIAALRSHSLTHFEGDVIFVALAGTSTACTGASSRLPRWCDIKLAAMTCFLVALLCRIDKLLPFTVCMCLSR
jgi:hypothetical protein